MLLFVLFLIVPIALIIVVPAIRANRWDFLPEERKAGTGYRLLVQVITVPLGTLGIGVGAVGLWMWLGGVMYHSEPNRAQGTYLFWLGVLAFGSTILLRGWLLPLLIRKKPEPADAIPPVSNDPENPLPSTVRFDAAAIYQPEQSEKSQGQRILRVVWPFCFIGLGLAMSIWPNLLDGQQPERRINGHHRSFSSIAFDHLLYWLWGIPFGVVLILIGVAAVWFWVLGRNRSSEYNWPR